ncbi:hypothetical protein Q7P37_006285 [Cladosporium fusiforme]
MAPSLQPSSTAAPKLSAVVHPIHAQSNGTWQYVVANPDTNHCIVLDSVRDNCADPAAMSTTAADAVIALVKERKYVVDYILETHSAGNLCRSAAWYVRMQMSEHQDRPPQLCNEGTVTGLEAMWQRKYGADSKFSTSIRPALEDEEILPLGDLSITCLHMPGFGTAHRRAFVVGENVFGAHSIATMEQFNPTDQNNDTSKPNTEPGSPSNDTDVHSEAWVSMTRILSLPGDSRIWWEESASATQQTDPHSAVSQCAANNKYARLSESEFIAYQQAKAKASTHGVKAPSLRHGGLKARLGGWMFG